MYLARAAKDPAAPKRLRLHVDKDYPWARVRPLLDACKQAGFAAPELATARGEPAAPGTKSHVIEPADVLRLVVAVRGGDGATPLADANGDFPVRPDGTVSLGAFGAVKAAGRTADQVRDAIRDHLAAAVTRVGRHARPEALDVCVAVSAADGGRYYVVTSDPEGLGGVYPFPATRECVYPFPATGGETVVDAVSRVEGLAARAAAGRVWVARRPARGGDPVQILPVDWAGITRHGATRTNYQLLPGDRVYVRSKE